MLPAASPEPGADISTSSAESRVGVPDSVPAASAERFLREARIFALAAVLTLIGIFAIPWRFADPLSVGGSLKVLFVLTVAHIAAIEFYKEDSNAELELCRVRWSVLAFIFLLLSATHPILNDMQTWSDQFITILLAVISISCWCRYLRLSWRTGTEPSELECDTTFLVGVTDLQSAAGALDVSPNQARVFYELVSTAIDYVALGPVAARNPTAKLDRITQRLDPDALTLRIATTAYFRIKKGASDETVVLPVAFQPRGKLFSGLRIHLDDKRISSLQDSEMIPFILAVMRKYIGLSGPASLNDYIRTVEPSVIGILASFGPSASKSIDVTADKITALRAHAPFRSAGLGPAHLIFRTLAVQYPLCVSFALTKTSVNARESSGYGRWPIERLVRYRKRGAGMKTEQRIAGAPEYERVRIRYEHIDTLGVHTQGVRGFLHRSYVALREISIRALGLRPTKVHYLLSDASRASSYHLYIQGAEGTYLSRQRIVPVGSSELIASWSAAYAVPKRQGQDFAHIYGRPESNKAKPPPLFEATFSERPPGSISVASLSAIAAVILVAIAAGDALGISELKQQVAIATLLSVPAAIGAWSGFQQSRTFLGGTLAARLSDLLTIAISFGALLMYALGPHTSADSGQEPCDLAACHGFGIWLMILLVAIGNALAVVGTWVVHMLVYHRILKARPRIHDPIEGGVRDNSTVE